MVSVASVAVARLWVRNYRSLVDVELRLGQITVVQGANASGKTNLYRALTLLNRGAHGAFARTVLAEGGMPSMLWAGVTPTPRRPQPVRMVFGVSVDDYSYELAVGLPNESAARVPPPMFLLDAEIKTERAWFGPTESRHSVLLDRGGISATARTEDEMVTFAFNLDPSEPALGHLGEPDRFPELFHLREELRRWRFYHSFPTDDTAPARRSQTGVRTPVLADDAHDLAAALATIDDMGSGPALRACVDQALGGAQLEIHAERGTFSIGLKVPGVRRAMGASELSDGTLRFLCLAAALLTPRPPPMLVFNEPETSLHPDVIPSLADLVAEASRNSQIVLTTHSTDLADKLVDLGADLIQVRRDSDGATIVTD